MRRTSKKVVRDKLCMLDVHARSAHKCKACALALRAGPKYCALVALGVSAGCKH